MVHCAAFPSLAGKTFSPTILSSAFEMALRLFMQRLLPSARPAVSAAMPIAELLAGWRVQYGNMPSGEVDPHSRIPSGYTLYIKEKLPSLKAQDEHKEKRAAELMSICAAQWKTLSAADKSKYNAQAQDIKKATLAARAALPRRPPNAYALFVQEKFPGMATRDTSGRVSVVSTGQKLAAAWKALGAADKQSYVDKAAALSEAYQQMKAEEGSFSSSGSDSD